MEKEFSEQIHLIAGKYGKFDFLGQALDKPGSLELIIGETHTGNTLVNGTVMLCGGFLFLFGTKGFQPANPSELKILLFPGVFFFGSFAYKFIRRFAALHALKKAGLEHKLM